MSAYNNVVGGKLKLKGKALDVKAGELKKKKKRRQQLNTGTSQLAGDNTVTSEHTELSSAEAGEEVPELDPLESNQPPNIDDHLTPAERRYIEQRERISAQRLTKTSNKSHRDRIQDFNEYLANLSEHYDIPKVGPG